MKTENKVLMAQARETLKGNWGKAVGVCLLSMAVAMVLSFIPVIGQIAIYATYGAFMFGAALFFLNLSRGKEATVDQLFNGFNYLGKTLGTYLLCALFVMLWSLLLIVPGIIAAYSYSLVYYILVDEPNLKPLEALRKSKKMMYGNKAKLFYLGLRFIGWALLCVLTLGVGFIWLAPYMQTTLAKFYEDVKKNFEAGSTGSMDTTNTTETTPSVTTTETVTVSETTIEQTV